MRALAALLVLVSSAAASPLDRLRPLLGSWETKGRKVRESYRFVSNDTALVQTYRTASGKETLTVFHADGADLVATHYCAQGNQPRLRLDPASTDTRLIFTFKDATNLTDEAAHLVKLELSLAGKDELVEVETYLEQGKPDVTTLRFVRAR